MKKYTLTNIEGHVYSSQGSEVFIGNQDMQVSDGYHTMDELYEHRIDLYIQLCRALNYIVLDAAVTPRDFVWRSTFHSDGTEWPGWFILGIGKEKGEQITYHLPLSKWEETNFAETLVKAPEYDGHTPSDVLERLKRL